MAYGVAGSTRLIEPEWKFLLNTVTYCFDFKTVSIEFPAKRNPE